MIAARPRPPGMPSPSTSPSPGPSATGFPEIGFAGIGLACRRGERLVFARLDFTLRAGGALILTGRNGSGKSSLLRLMAGLTPPESGDLVWDGVAVAEDRAAHRSRLHFIGHADALKPAFTVAETLDFWARMHGAGANPAGANPNRALARFRLDGLALLPCRLLSAGQRRRLALARLVASPAALWLLDEPLTGLDEDAVADLNEAIAAHREAGGRVALSTHMPLAIADAATLRLGDGSPR
jgi:heme exporter protein A